MKHSTLLMGMVAAAFLFASCAKEAIDEAAPGETVENGGGGEYVYLSARVELPSGDSFGTRSATDDKPDSPSDEKPDTEVGYDFENNVSTCLLVIADENNNFVAAAAVSGIRMQADGINGRPGFNATAQFPRQQLKNNAYNDDGSLKGTGQFRVFAFCNNSDLVTRKIAAIGRNEDTFTYTTRDGEVRNELLSKDLSLLTGFVEENPMLPGATPTTSNNIWAPNRFMMSNAKLKEVSLPENEEDWDKYTDADSPFNLSGANEEGPDNSGSIVVERLAARFDYRDASADEEEANGVGNNIYKVLGTVESSGGSAGMTTNLVNIKLSRIGLVNMAKDIYYLRRVSANGQNKPSDLCGLETSAYGEKNWFNYVVTPHAAEMKEGMTTADVWPWYNFPLYTKEVSDVAGANYYAKAEWSVYNLGDVVKGTQYDQWTGPEEGQKYKYHIWRYCTENAIPAGPGADNRENPLQDHIFTTGIVFKGKLLAGKYLGAHREGTVLLGENKVETPATVPYMSYNAQLAILASTLGLPLGEAEITNELVTAAKATAVAENGNLAELKLYKPNPDGGDGETIGWDKIDENSFAGMTSYPALYLFEGNLYAGFNEAAEYAYYDGRGGTLYQAMQDVMSHYWLKESDPVQITVAGVEQPVNGFVQMEGNPGAGYEQLTVEIFAEILGLRPQSSLLAGEKFHDRQNYGVRWVDTESNTDKETANFKRWLTNGDSMFHFTIYDATNEEDNYGEGDNSTSQGYGYYCYYFYWNRHNDNGVPGVMAPMEFSVVRNNVYKLAVTKINQIGHPIDPSNDPTPPDPHDDDEEQNVYLNLQVEVLPWTVRVNNIEF